MIPVRRAAFWVGWAPGPAIAFSMDGHRRLGVWQRAGDLTLEIYSLCSRLPRDENFVAIPQLKRAAWSVQNNIAEGNARRARGEKQRFCDYALSSLGEVDSMVGTLDRIYGIAREQQDAIERLRRQITRGVSTMRRQAHLIP